MNRIVIMNDTICGKPLYIAKDEEDAKAFLDQKVADALEGVEVERRNSLHLILRTPNVYIHYTCHTVPSWETVDS